MNLPPDGAVDSVAEDMAAFGVADFEPPEWMLEEQAPEEFGVLPENWETVNVFLACSTQWTRLADGRPSMLRYEAVESVMRMMKVDPADVFWRMRVMEQAALTEFAKMGKS